MNIKKSVCVCVCVSEILGFSHFLLFYWLRCKEENVCDEPCMNEARDLVSDVNFFLIPKLN